MARFYASLGQRPGNNTQVARGLKAQPSPPPCAIHGPITHDAERMKRAVGAQVLFVGMDWGVAPAWHEPGLWPNICAMPQSLSLVGIS